MKCPKCGHKFQQPIRLDEANRARAVVLARQLLLREIDQLSGRDFWLVVKQLAGPPSDYITPRRFLEAIRAYTHDPQFRGIGGRHRWLLKREVLTIVAGGNFAAFEGTEGVVL